MGIQTNLPRNLKPRGLFSVHIMTQIYYLWDFEPEFQENKRPKLAIWIIKSEVISLVIV